MPSYHNTVTVACIKALGELQAARKLDPNLSTFREYAKYGHYDDVRVAAASALIRIAFTSNSRDSSIAGWALSIAENDPSPRMRARILELLATPAQASEERSYFDAVFPCLGRIWAMLNSPATALDSRVRAAALKVYTAVFAWGKHFGMISDVPGPIPIKAKQPIRVKAVMGGSTGLPPPKGKQQTPLAKSGNIKKRKHEEDAPIPSPAPSPAPSPVPTPAAAPSPAPSPHPEVAGETKLKIVVKPPKKEGSPPPTTTAHPHPPTSLPSTPQQPTQKEQATPSATPAAKRRKPTTEKKQTPSTPQETPPPSSHKQAATPTTKRTSPSHQPLSPPASQTPARAPPPPTPSPPPPTPTPAPAPAAAPASADKAGEGDKPVKVIATGQRLVFKIGGKAISAKPPEGK